MSEQDSIEWVTAHRDEALERVCKVVPGAIDYAV